MSTERDALAHSFRYCQRLARARARNFYYSFLVLPPERRAAMCAVYAFFRYADDVTDDLAVPDAADRLAAWRAALEAAYAGETAAHPILPAFREVTRRYAIPAIYFRELIEGAAMDLAPRRYETFDDLYRYCYCVASTVGLVCLHIFGFSDTRALVMAEACGIAFQLTNILRDIGEDAARGRVYLPQEDLRRFGCPEETLLRGEATPAFRELMRFEAARAWEYYERARPLVGLVEPASRPCLRAMIEIYSRLLRRIERCGYDVFRTRVALPAWSKLAIAGRAWIASRLHRPG